MKKRGQAALEFLSTYGFAFLIILVMIGALSYFGVLSPGRFLPERCLVNQEFTCNEFQLDRIDDASTQINFELINNLGNTVSYNVSSMNLSSEWGTGGCWKDAARTDNSAESVIGGGGMTFYCTINAEFPAEGEKLKVQFDGNYVELGKTFPRAVNGEIFATLQ